jgi:hypothetical protein
LLVLTIGKLGASAGRLGYYERQVAAGAEDYFAGRGESPGSWSGGGLGALGVAAGSRVEREAFLGLMEGRHPRPARSHANRCRGSRSRRAGGASSAVTL